MRAVSSSAERAQYYRGMSCCQYANERSSVSGTVAMLSLSQAIPPGDFGWTMGRVAMTMTTSTYGDLVSL